MIGAVSRTRIRALIVDDEPLARSWVRRQLDEDDDVEVVGEAEDGFKAVTAVEELGPDLLFLDVQMPGVDGFGVLEMLGGESVPAVVFVTAFDRYAVRAFEVNATDYVMKPFSRERFRKALERVKERLRPTRRAAGPDAGVQGLMTHLRSSGRYPQWLLVKSGGKSVFVKVREIDWVEAARNHVVLHAGARELPFRATMKGLEDSLDPALFLRIHRSTIVNIERVQEMEPWFNGEYRVVLKDGKELTLSANYRSALARFRQLPA